MLLSSEFLLICLGSKWQPGPTEHNNFCEWLISDILYYSFMLKKHHVLCSLPAWSCQSLSMFPQVWTSPYLRPSMGYGSHLDTLTLLLRRKTEIKGKKDERKWGCTFVAMARLNRNIPSTWFSHISSYCCKNKTAESCERPAVVCAVFSIRGAIEHPSVHSGPLLAANLQLKVELCGFFSGFTGCKTTKTGAWPCYEERS